MQLQWTLLVGLTLACAVPSDLHGAAPDTKRPANSAVCAVVNLHGFVVGGTVAGKWVSARQMAKRLHGGESYINYSRTGRAGVSTGSRPSPRYLDVTLSPDLSGYIGITGKWNALPKKVSYRTTNNESYVPVVRRFLKSRGFISRGRIDVEEVAKADLSGNGAQDTLICAQSAALDTVNFARGQFSLVLLLRRDKSGNTAVRLLRASAESGPLRSDVPMIYSIGGVWDLDGDGAMEVAVDYAAPPYESYGTLVYKMKDGLPVLVTSIRPNIDYPLDAQQ